MGNKGNTFAKNSLTLLDNHFFYFLIIMTKLLLFLPLCAMTLAGSAQKQAPSRVNKIDHKHTVVNNQTRQYIAVPMVDGLVPLKCDFHLHTVFSDGAVWPTIRVDEAYRDGLDAIALTDHIEYRPKAKELPTDNLNRPYEIATPAAKNKGILLVAGTEITRQKPEGGHLNALFVSDANALKNSDPNKQIDAAAAQGAFVIWNHPGWSTDTCKMYELNERWIAQGKVHAVEVFNEQEFYPRAVSWLAPFKLAPIAASDAHDPIDALYTPQTRRPMTLVFAKERSLESLKEALFARRTVAWFADQLAGEAAWLEKLFRASVTIEKRGERQLEWINKSDIPYQVCLDGVEKPLMLFARTSQVIHLPKEWSISKPLRVKVVNAHVTEDENLVLEIKW